jgi:hypothetical protein
VEFLLVLLGIIVLVVGYFCIGIFVKFLLAWWILAIGVPALLVIGFAFGWAGAIASIIGFAVLLNLNNHWHECELYLAIERKVDRTFYLSDT